MDEYGGLFENCMWFLLDIIVVVWVEVNDFNFVVGVRIFNEDYVLGGFMVEFNVGIVKVVDLFVDYVFFYMGVYWCFYKLIVFLDDLFGVEMIFNKKIMLFIIKLCIVMGCIMIMDYVSFIVKNGEVDMVLMVWVLIVDLDLVNKVRLGNEYKICLCVGINMGCVGWIMIGVLLFCVVNIVVVREKDIFFEFVDKVLNVKKVFVVGGGLVGFEVVCMVLMWGYKVELYEVGK